jgi:predicted transposase YbfD/YdcC
MLELLEMTGALVTIDSMGCQHAIASATLNAKNEARAVRAHWGHREPAALDHGRRVPRRPHATANRKRTGGAIQGLRRAYADISLSSKNDAENVHAFRPGNR